ncbi:MAG: YbaN family protein [Ignavibacteriae bacterium]|nr:YbaN family protein [Ignavibacteriota bacterium]
MDQKTKITLDIKENRLVRLAWVFLGFLMVVMGIIGALLPVIPGTVFFILAALAFAKGSEKFYKMLIHNKYVGPHLQNYLEEKFIPIRTKIIIIASLWVSITVSSVYVVDVFWQRVLMFLFAIGVSVYIIMHRSKKSSE